VRRGGIQYKTMSGKIVSCDMYLYVSSHCLNRCMEYTINLAAGSFITTVFPTSAHKLLKKIKAAFKCAELEGKDVDLDALEADLKEMDDEGEGDGGDNQEDEDEKFGVGDTIGKALALVKQVRRRPAGLVSAVVLLSTCYRFVHHHRLVLFLPNRVSKQMFPSLS
jgi:hypothetical protein